MHYTWPHISNFTCWSFIYSYILEIVWAGGRGIWDRSNSLCSHRLQLWCQRWNPLMWRIRDAENVWGKKEGCLSNVFHNSIPHIVSPFYQSQVERTYNYNSNIYVLLWLRSSSKFITYFNSTNCHNNLT